jgi:hypothetical protein
LKLKNEETKNYVKTCKDKSELLSLKAALKKKPSLTDGLMFSEKEKIIFLSFRQRR